MFYFKFVTGYVIELSLSIDNLFLFLLIFRYFKPADEHQHKVLLWESSVLSLCAESLSLLELASSATFSWITYAFGALLVYSGLRLLRQGKKEIDPEKNFVLRLFRRALPVTPEYVDGKFLVRRDGDGDHIYATPLLVVLLVIETSDILFAVDSIPAVLAITLNAFLVYTSNVFAILGLRSMYFALAGMMDRFHFLHYGLSLVLILVGIKMLGAHYIEIPTEWTLGSVLLILGVSIVGSLLCPQKK